MSRQKPWDLPEAVILLEGLLLTRSGKISRKEAISRVSEQLRNMAQNAGISIDEVYRNINGITFQMGSMESALAGHTLTKPPTRLFLQTVEIYRNDPERYQKILKEANRMINDQWEDAQLEICADDPAVSDQQELEGTPAELIAAIKNILASKFMRGYRMGSKLDLRRMKQYLAAQLGDSFHMSDEALEHQIQGSTGLAHNCTLWTRWA